MNLCILLLRFGFGNNLPIHLRQDSIIEFANGFGQSVEIYEINALIVIEFCISYYVQKEHTYFPKKQAIIWGKVIFFFFAE